MIAKLVELALSIALALLPDLLSELKASKDMRDAELRARALFRRRGLEAGYNEIRKQL